MTTRDYIYLTAKRSLGTRELLDQCIDLVSPDKHGRDIPGYIVIHEALELYRDSHLPHSHVEPAASVATD